MELGHLLSSTDLNRNNAALDDVAFVNKSSLRTIAKLPGYKLSDLVRGPFSLGTLLMSRGYKAVPSALNPHPAGQGFFNGGYNTSRHGSRIGGTIDGTQVETYSGMISTLSGRDNYAYMLALSIRDFLEHHYKWKLKDPAWRPPAHQACLAAKKIQLVNGGALITGSTAGASNEFGQQINCGGSNAWDGHQVYYRVKLIPGANYEISLTPSFSARLYLFGDSCSPSTINIQCAKSGLSGKLIVPNQTITTAVKAGPYSLHTIAVDANSKPYYGSFKLQIKKL